MKLLKDSPYLNPYSKLSLGSRLDFALPKYVNGDPVTSLWNDVLSKCSLLFTIPEDTL
jgi:hypothetical protein